MEITQEAKNKIKAIFPGLNFIINSKNEILLKGNLVFAARYVPELNNYEFLKPKSNYGEVKGSFSIENNLSKSNPYREVYEIGGEIEKIAEKLGYDNRLYKLHSQKQNLSDKRVRVCVSGYLREDQNIDLVKYFCEVVAAFFCDLIFFKNKHIWPRGEIGHFIPGLFEDYADLLVKNEAQQLTERCLNEFLAQENESNFTIYKELLLYEGKIKGHWRKRFWDEDSQNWIEDAIKSYIGENSYEGLWRFKDNLRKFNLLTEI